MNYIRTYGANGYFQLPSLNMLTAKIRCKLTPRGEIANGIWFGSFQSSGTWFAVYNPCKSWPDNTLRLYYNNLEKLLATYDSYSTDIKDHPFEIEWEYPYIKVNGITEPASNANRTTQDFGIGYGLNGGSDQGQALDWEYFQIYDNGTLVYDLVPAFNNGVYCFKNQVDDSYIYATGTVDGRATSIIATPSKSFLANIGETINITVECENAWTVTGNTWLTLSSTGDTGSTTITATAPSYTGTTERTDTLTFTDTVTGDEWEITLKQKKYTSGQPVYLGGNEVTELYLGGSAVSEAYLGDVLVYSSGPFEGLKAIPSSLSFNSAALTKTLKVKSSEAWTMTLPSWITASTTTGDTGETLVTITAAAQADTAGTVTITSANYSVNISCEYIVQTYTELAYVYEDGSSSYIQTHHIDTGIEHTSSTMSIEFEYYGLGGNSDRMVGYQDGDNGCRGDYADFRLFGYNSGCFDYGDGRYNVRGYNTGYHHCTIGDCFCYNNETSTYEIQNPALWEIPSPNCHILVDVSFIKVKSVKIKKGDTVLFDGVAAVEEGVYGLYDRVSSTMKTNTGFTITGDALS